MTYQLQFPEPVQGVVDPAAGEAAKAEGMAAAAEHTDQDWAVACRAAIETMAARGIVFQAADLIAENLVGEPDHPARWGAAFQAAARAGAIVEAGFAQSKRATVHKSICKVWTGAAQQGRAAA
ncbi:hypothetical protein [Streptomyces sp. NPDC059783]|uniref:hypothetical protein n=1 Tax=Streptomyces sp. NPDC059783 TaxID=3346944 RepID=UPI00365C8A83